MTPPDTLTAPQFQALCALLWGESWRPAAADALGVNLRNVQFWAAEPPARSKPVPEGVARELADMVRRRMEFDPEDVRAYVARHASQTAILLQVTAPENAERPDHR